MPCRKWHTPVSGSNNEPSSKLVPRREKMQLAIRAHPKYQRTIAIAHCFGPTEIFKKNKLRTYPQQLDSSSASFHFSHICNLPEPHLGICTRTFCTGTSPRCLRQNLLHRNLPEPNLSICTRTFCTLRNLARNLVLKLHRIAPELIWAKDPIAKCCCWGKT